MKEFRISLVGLQRALAALVVIGLVALPQPRDALGAAVQSVLDPTPEATSAEFAPQSSMAARAIGRAHERGVRQLRTTRELILSISKAEADAIEARALGEMKQLRAGALAALAAAGGLRGDAAAAYVSATERTLDAGVPAEDAQPTLLAPTVARIIQQLNDLIGPIADRATRELTAARAPSPSPARSPSPLPTR